MQVSSISGSSSEDDEEEDEGGGGALQGKAQHQVPPQIVFSARGWQSLQAMSSCIENKMLHNAMAASSSQQ